MLIAPAGALLLLGLYAGLLLIGVPLPSIVDRLAESHAPLLVFGFVGTLISLERAVALRRLWAYSAPVLLAIGGLLTLSSAPPASARLFIVLGLLAHLAQYYAIWRRQPMTATAVQAVGVAAGVAAALVWTAGVAVAPLVPLLAAFLVLTIAGERLELARVTAPGLAAERMLYVLAVALATSASVSLIVPAIAVPIAGIVLVLIVAWLMRFDVARVTVHRTGLPRFVALCLLTGYGWLTVAGVGWLLGGARIEGAVYDATTHAVFLGFVITMIMAHAPLILPAVLQVSIPYHPVLYAPVGLVQAGLLVRVIAGDAWGIVPALQLGGAVSVAGILLFAAAAITLTLRARRAARKEAARVAA